MKFLNYDTVLCVSPHPDDIEYSMMGTILKHVDTHFIILNLDSLRETFKGINLIDIKSISYLSIINKCVK